jgi:hypothetical protein
MTVTEKAGGTTKAAGKIATTVAAMLTGTTRMEMTTATAATSASATTTAATATTTTSHTFSAAPSMVGIPDGSLSEAIEPERGWPRSVGLRAEF